MPLSRASTRGRYSCIVGVTKGSKVDVEVLRDRIPLRQNTGKGPMMGSHEDRNLQWRKSISGVPLWYTRNIWVSIELRLGLEDLRGIHKPWRRPLGHGLLACGHLVAPLASSRSFVGVFLHEKSSKSFVLFGLRLVLIFCKRQKQGKNSNWH